MQEINRGHCALQILSRNTRQAAALATDSYVETFVALFAQLGYRDVLAHFHAGLYLHTYLAHDINLGFDDVLVQFVGRYAVSEHTAGFGIAFEHSRLVPHRR